MPPLIAAQRLPLKMLLTIGAAGGLVIFLWSYTNWRRTVKTVFVVALLEGAIRKWVFPQGQELVYFLKDAFLAGAYAKFYFAPEVELRGWRLHVPAFSLSVAAAIVALNALNPNIGSPLLALYGIKIYLYYIPLAFMMPYLFRTEREMVRQLTWYALLSIPICLLGVVQFFAGTESKLNVYAQAFSEGSGGAVAFGNMYEHARITGTFSYLSGLVTFLIVYFGLVMALLTIKEVSGRVRAILLFVCIPLLAANALMSGSRAAVMYGALIFMCFAVATTFFNVSTVKSTTAVWLTMLGIVMVGASYFFKESLRAWESRRDSSGDTVSSRLVMISESVSKAAKEVDYAGFGIGAAHPAVASMRRILDIPPPRKPCPSYDAELGQVYAELGAAGFLAWYFIRILVFYTTWQAMSGAPPSPRKAIFLMCFIFQGLHLIGSVVYNHTAAFFVWATYGICLIPNLQSSGRRVARVPVASRT